jgi:HEAT repeat protein
MYAWSPLPRSRGAALRDGAHAKARVRLSAVADLARWASTEDGEPCVARLAQMAERDPDLEVRAAAVLALADAEAESALPVVLAAARSAEPRVRQMALVALGELAPAEDPRAVDVLRHTLDDAAPALRFQALVAAGRLFATDELAACLTRALEDGEANLRYVACRIVEERFFFNADIDETRRAAIQRELVPLLSDPDADVSVAAAVLLAPRGIEAARAVLVNALNRRRSFAHVDDEQAAIDLCAELRLEAALPGLRARAFGGVFRGASALSFQARVALARLGDERARQQILRGLSAWNRGVRTQSVAAAGRARLEAARPRLLQMRETGEVDRSSVEEALEALGRPTSQE